MRRTTMYGMRNDRSRRRRLKEQLPYPYNQDFSKVLRGMKRRNPITRRSRQANDPVTAAYLAAAVRLIQRHLGPGAIRTSADGEDPDSIERPLLSFLSQRAVAAEVGHLPPPFHRVGSPSTLRQRWEPQSNFVADVLRFCLRPWHYPASHQVEVADAKDEVIRGPDPVRNLHRFCYWNLTRLLDTPMFRLGLIAAAEAEGDPVIGEALSGGTGRTARCGRTSMRSSCRLASSGCGRGSRSMTAPSCWPPSRTVLPCVSSPILPPPSSTGPGGAACSERPRWP